MGIEQVIDQKVKEWIGDSVVQNIARQARVEELMRDLNALQQRVADLSAEVRSGSEPELPLEPAKPNGSGAH